MSFSIPLGESATVDRFRTSIATQKLYWVGMKQRRQWDRLSMATEKKLLRNSWRRSQSLNDPWSFWTLYGLNIFLLHWLSINWKLLNVCLASWRQRWRRWRWRFFGSIHTKVVVFWTTRSLLRGFARSLSVDERQEHRRNQAIIERLTRILFSAC